MTTIDGKAEWRRRPDRHFGLPRDTDAAAALARRRDARMTGRARIAFGPPRRLRHALEVRHASFVDPSFIALIRRQQVAFVIADTAGKWPEYEDVTADFVYIRLHGFDLTCNAQHRHSGRRA